MRFQVPDENDSPIVEVAAAPRPAKKKPDGEKPKLKKNELPPLKDQLVADCNDSFAKAKSKVRVSTVADAVYKAEVTQHVLTGIHSLDLILTQGYGLPCGRSMEVYGNEGSGKTALCEYLMGRYVHKLGSPPHLLDYEHSMDTGHHQSYDIDEDDVLLADVTTVEDGWNYISTQLATLRARAAHQEKHGQKLDPPALFVWDSLAQAPSRAELEEDDHGDSHVGLMPRAVSKGFRKHTRDIAMSHATLIFVNQVRDKIGVRGNGPKTDTPGGRAAKFAYSIRLNLARIETLKRGDLPIGHIIKATTKKNKHAPYPMSADVVLSYTNGIDPDWSNFMWFRKNRYIVAAGSKGFRWKTQGESAEPWRRSDFAQFVKENKTEVGEARKAIFAEELATTEITADDDEDSSEEAGGED